MRIKPAGIVITLITMTLFTAACSERIAEAPPATASISTGIPLTPTQRPTDTPPTPTEAPATATIEPMPTDTPAPTATTTIDLTYLRVPSVSCCRGRTLEAGRYEIPPWLGIPLSVDVPEGWRALNEEMALLFLLGRGENAQNNPSQMVLFLNATTEGGPEQIIDSIGSAPELIAMGEPTEVTLAGFPGRQLDLSALPNPAFEGRPQDDIPAGVQYLPVIENYLTPGFAWTTSTPEARVRVIALTVGEQTLLLYLEAPPDEMDQLTADAEAILQSLELTGP